MVFFRQAFSKERLLVSGTYAGSLFATLYFAMIVQSTAITILFAVVEVITLLFMIVGEVPGGMTGMKFFGSLCRRSVSSTLPV